MKKYIVILFSLLAVAANAQLISVDELSKIIKNDNVVVVDARAAGDYAKTHIDGAINIPVASLNTNSPVEGTLKSPAQLADVFGKSGVAKNNKIVLYCKTGVSAGYLYWVLKYLGADDVSILDGQMDAWFAARKPITKNPAKLAPVTFSPAVNAGIMVNKAQLKAKMNSAILIDSRAKADYDAGHIGNAISIPSESMLVKSKLKSTAELAKLFSGVDKNKEVIVYCKTGVTAGLTYFVLKSMLKYPNVKVYEGGWVEWN